MAYLNSLETVRQIDWAQSYLWDIRFDGAPGPFSNWFPAVDVEEGIAVCESKAFSSFHTESKIPIGTSPLTLKITFLDDARHTLLTWLETWIKKEILNNGRGISPLENCVKLVHILKLNRQREVVKTGAYWVYPETSLVFRGDSASKEVVYDVPFIIVGKG